MPAPKNNPYQAKIRLILCPPSGNERSRTISEWCGIFYAAFDHKTTPSLKIEGSRICGSGAFPLSQAVFCRTGQQLIDGTANDLLKMGFDLNHLSPPVQGRRVKPIAERDIHKPLFQQAKACGQGQRVTELDQQVVIIIDGIHTVIGSFGLVSVAPFTALCSGMIKGVLRAEDLSLSLNERSVFVDGKPIQLSYKEFELLKVFLENPGEVFSRKLLHDQIWGGTYNEKTRTVDIHVQTLRKKLGKSGNLIESVKYIGYRMKKVP